MVRHHSELLDLDEKAKAKVVSLYTVHKITITNLAERFGRSASTIKGVLEAAGALKTKIKNGPVLERAFSAVEEAAIAGDRCPMNETIPGGGRSLSILARDGRILVEVYVHNFRRVTILKGTHKGKSTAEPPLYGGKPPKPYLTVGLVKRRNGAVIPSTLDARSP